MRRAFRLPGTRHRIERELDEEVRFHVERRARALEAAGLSPEEAEAEAWRKFGDVEDLRQYCMSIDVAHLQRARWRERLDTIGQDFRFALRQFRRAPGFAAVAAMTLALGTGATTAIFSVVNGVVLRPLPFDHSDQLVELWGLDAKGHELHFADPTFDTLAASNHTLSAVAEYSEYGMSIVDHGEVFRVNASAVSKQFFNILRTKPAIGRFFDPNEQRVGAPMAIVISDGLWTRQFGKSPSVIGSTMRSGTEPVTVVGVLRPGQELPADVDIWYSRERYHENDSYTAHNWRVIGRVRPGATLAQANRDVSAVLRHLHDAVGDATWTFDGAAVSLLDEIVGNFRILLGLAFAASGVLLLIACANVASLGVARMAARQEEMAVRLAIGAGRARLAQQLLVETSTLSALGCVGGLMIGAAGMRLLLLLRPALIPRVGELSLDWHVLVFAMAVSAATAIVLGLAAAWRTARGDLRATLSQSQRMQGGGGASYRLRGSLVVVQLAMTVVLLVAAGLLAKSFVREVTIDPGFRTRGMVVASMPFDTGVGANGMARRTRYYDDITERARAIPGVTGVGVSDAAPFAGGSSNGDFLILSNASVTVTPQEMETLFRDKAHTGWATYRLASPDYFKALGIPVLEGRVFDDDDRAGTPEVAVINASLAKKQWPNENPIGKVVNFGNIDDDMTPATIVGVVGDTREEDLALDPEPVIFFSYRQRPGSSTGDMYVILSTATEAATIRSARQTFRQLRADVPMRFQTIEDIVGRSMGSQRFMLLLVGVFSAIALLLATLGVYSVISFVVAQRGRELSIRVALGASASEIARLVLGQGVALSLVGAVVGGAAALGATRVLEHVLYQVSTTDPVAFGGVLVVLCAAALVASYFPARRAARLAPMDVLRAG
jgi:predicted permease